MGAAGSGSPSGPAQEEREEGGWQHEADSLLWGVVGGKRARVALRAVRLEGLRGGEGRRSVWQCRGLCTGRLCIRVRDVLHPCP